MEPFLAHTYHHWIYLLIICTVASGAWIVLFRRRDLSEIKKTTWLWLLAIIILGALLRYGLSPMQPQVFHDEFFYLSGGENAAKNNLITPFIPRSFPASDSQTYRFHPPYPYGWPAVLSIAFKITGQCTYRVASVLTFVMSTLVPLGAFFAAYFLMCKLGPDDKTRAVSGSACGLASALTWACLPVMIKLSGCASTEPASAFFISVFLGALFFYHRKPSNPALLFLASTGGLMISIRPENLLYLLIAVIILIRKKNRIARDGGWPALFIIGVSVLAAALIMSSGSLDPSRSHVFRHIPREAFSGPVANTLGNLWNNLLFLSGVFGIHPVALTIFFTFGIYRMIAAGDCPVRGYLLGGWTLLFYLVLSALPFGDFASRHSLDAYRFSIHLYFPLIMAASYGIYFTACYFKKTAPHRLACAALFLLILLPTFGMNKFFRAGHPQRYYFRVAKELTDKLPQNGILMAEEPEQVLMLHFARGGYAGLLQTPGDCDRLEPGNRPVFLFSPGTPSDVILEHFNLEPYSRHSRGIMGYTLYRIEKMK